MLRPGRPFGLKLWGAASQGARRTSFSATSKPPWTALSSLLVPFKACSPPGPQSVTGFCRKGWSSYPWLLCCVPWWEGNNPPVCKSLSLVVGMRSERPGRSLRGKQAASPGSFLKSRTRGAQRARLRSLPSWRGRGTEPPAQEAP